MKVAIWLDDFRDPDLRIWRDLIAAHVDVDKVLWTKSYKDFVGLFPDVVKEHQLMAVFFDNDLGEEKEGRHAFSWMEQYIHENDETPSFTLFAQTSNPAAKQELLLGFAALERFWAPNT